MPQDERTSQMLRDRTRTALWAILTCVALFTVADIGIDPAVFAVAYTIKGLLVVFLLLMFLCLRGPLRPRRTLALAFATINVTYALFALGDIVKGHLETTPQLAVVCSLSAAAVLPWGLWPQLATATLIELASLWLLALTERPLNTLIDPAASITAALGVSVYVAYEFSRFRSDSFRNEAELERVNQLKSEFVSTMSHELRTPLNVIIGYLDLLEDPDWNDANLSLERIRHASRELHELIEATLDLSRLEAGCDAAVFSVTRLDLLWRELATEFGGVPHTADVTLTWHGEPDAILRTDPRKLKTIVKNLVGNALKFTACGEVSVRYALDDTSCEIAVRDTGVGIPAEHLPHIFEMFRQVDSTDRRAYGGVGLGLHIVQRYAALLGGTIEVESVLGRGSVFTLRLPSKAPKPHDHGRVQA